MLFVDRVDDLIWVVFVQNMHLLSESHILCSLNGVLSLNYVLTEALRCISPDYSGIITVIFSCTVCFSLESLSLSILSYVSSLTF